MVSDMVMIVFHDMHDNHKLESCYSHENKQYHDFSMTFWEIFTFQDFSMTAIFSRIFQDFHDCGKPGKYKPLQLTFDIASTTSRPICSP